MRRALVALVCAALLAGCGGGGGEGEEPAGAAGLELVVEGLGAGAPIPPRHTCDGEDVSPAVSWGEVPPGTLELALVLDDPDAEGGRFTHWLVFDLPAREGSIPEGVPAEGALEGPTPFEQGENGFGETGYGGPCPPEGETHTYVLLLLALRGELGLEPGADRAEFDRAVEGKVLAQARVEATYSR